MIDKEDKRKFEDDNDDDTKHEDKKKKLLALLTRDQKGIKAFYELPSHIQKILCEIVSYIMSERVIDKPRSFLSTKALKMVATALSGKMKSGSKTTATQLTPNNPSKER